LELDLELEHQSVLFVSTNIFTVALVGGFELKSYVENVTAWQTNGTVFKASTRMTSSCI